MALGFIPRACFEDKEFLACYSSGQYAIIYAAKPEDSRVEMYGGVKNTNIRERPSFSFNNKTVYHLSLSLMTQFNDVTWNEEDLISCKHALAVLWKEGYDLHELEGLNFGNLDVQDAWEELELPW